MYLSYDVYRFMFAGHPPDERLAILRAEAPRHLPVIQGYGQVLHHQLSRPGPLPAAEDIQHKLERMVAAATDLQDLLWALTFAPKDYGRMDLQPFATLFDAVVTVATEVTPAFAQYLASPKSAIHSNYPLVVRTHPVLTRQCSVELHQAGYLLTLMLAQNLDHGVWEEHHMVVPSLTTVVEYMTHWLLEEVPLTAFPA